MRGDGRWRSMVRSGGGDRGSIGTFKRSQEGRKRIFLIERLPAKPLIWSGALLPLPPLAKHGGDHTSEKAKAEQDDNISLLHGTSSEYLAKRIARDHPAILERMKATVRDLRNLCRDDLEVCSLIDEATKGKQGERTDLGNNVTKVEGRPEGNSRDKALRRLRKSAFVYPGIHLGTIVPVCASSDYLSLATPGFTMPHTIFSLENNPLARTTNYLYNTPPKATTPTQNTP